jgi:hypothetical protein
MHKALDLIPAPPNKQTNKKTLVATLNSGKDVENLYHLCIVGRNVK